MARFICPVCKEEKKGLGSTLSVCPQCVRERWEESRSTIEAIHARSRSIFNLSLVPPDSPSGISCPLCLHKCRMDEGERGYCGIRSGDRESMRKDGRLRGKFCYYHDPIPTNCVADWVCPGGTGAGFPKYARDNGTEVGFYNLAVFFESCNFNCLYCQNWSFKKKQAFNTRWKSIESLEQVVNDQTSCVCFFGGDPTPQLPFALRASEYMRRMHADQILRFCWETNGSMHPAWLKKMARLSLESGGCIKMDLKAWTPQVHRALCGCENGRVLENFAGLARSWVPLRHDPPLLVASTVLVPGYVDEKEVWEIARFIASLDRDIPYVLLAFAPEFHLDDFPTTSPDHAEACMELAKKAGLRRVRLGNRHLVGARCF